MDRPLLAILWCSLLLGSARAELILTEFQARGQTRWIEFHNSDGEAIALAGYTLRLSPGPGGAVWAFPDGQSIPGGGFLVLALGDGDGEIDLQLPRRAGYLALSDPADTLLTVYDRYPAQRDDISYGRHSVNGEPRYFLTPTPGAANRGGVEGFVGDTRFSVDGGYHNAPLQLEITSETEGAAIFYTTDGSVPGLLNAQSLRVDGPIPIERTTVIRAMATKFGHVSTNVDTHTYLFLHDVLDQPERPPGFPPSWGDGPGVVSPLPGLADYAIDPRIRNATYVDMDGEAFTLADALESVPALSLVLPIGSLLDPRTGLHAEARNKGAEWERPLSLEFIDASGQRQFQIDGGFRMQGGWNRYPESFKKSFRFYFRSEYGTPKLEYPLFPDSSVRRFDTLILRSGNGKTWSSPWRPLTGSSNNSLERTTYLRDQLPRDLQHDMGHPTSHGRFVHLYINGLYWGLYNLVERVDEWFGPSYLGGDEEEYDVIKWIRSEGMVISAGDAVIWNELLRLVRGNVNSAETYAAIASLLDLENLVDYMLINFYIGNTDWPDNNSYAFRRRTEDGRFRFVCWDSEESLVGATTSSLGKNNPTTAAELFQRLLASTEFRILLMDRIHRHFSPGGLLTDEHVHRRFLGRAREIDRAIVGESARWGDLLRPNQPYTRDHWMAELDNLEQRFFGLGSGSREAFTYSGMRSAGWTSKLTAPQVTPLSGFVANGGPVKLAKKSLFTGGSLHYTTDGSDPRLPGGAVNPQAKEGAGSFTLDTSLTIRARMHSGTAWGPLTERHYHIGVAASREQIRISELLYHPESAADPEFIELVNVSTSEVNLIGAAFNQGIRFEFTGDTRLGPGEHAILTEDRARFVQRYGSEIRILGEFAGGTRLSNGGETVTLVGADGEVIFSLRYDDSPPWPEAADGGGYSLVAEGSEWRLSQEIGGSPGASEPADKPTASLLAGDPMIIREAGVPLLVVERWSHVPDASISGEFSRDLLSWMPLEAPTESASPGGGQRVRLHWALPDPGGHSLYARVRVAP